MTKGTPYKLILAMALPIMMGNIFQQLYSTVDAIIVGRYLGSSALAAVGSTTSIYFVILWFVCGLSNGYAVVLAQNYGAKEYDKLRKGVFNAILLAVSVTVAVTVFWLVILRPFMALLKYPDEIFESAVLYLTVMVAGVIATMFYNLCAAILRAMGDSRTPFVFIIISSVLNIVLDLIFIRVFNWGVFGAAFATVLSQAVSGLMCAVHMYRHFEIIRFRREDMHFDRDISKKMLSYGIPSGLSGIVTAIGIMVLQVAINVYGTTIIAGYTAAIKIQNFVEIPFMAFSMTMVSYSGQNLGANEYDHMHLGYIHCMVMGVLLSIFLGAVVFFFGGRLASLFVDKSGAEEIVAFAKMYLKVDGLFFIPFCTLMVTRSCLQGMGFSSAPVINGVVESGLRIAATVYLINYRNVKMLCYVSPIIWSVVAVMMVIMYICWYKHLMKSRDTKPVVNV